MSDEKKRVIITGASGFVGSALCAYLLARGLQVTALYRRAQPPELLLNLQKEHPEDCQLLRCDLTREESYQHVFHGAFSLVHVAAMVSDWGPYKHFYQQNVEVTRSLLKLAERNGLRQFVNISSIVVHGERGHLQHCSEEGPYFAPLSNYAKTKKAAEALVLAANHEGFHCLSLRPGNIYGPGDTTTLFPLLEAIEARKMALVSGGKTQNPVLYIDDLLQVIYLALQKAENYQVHGEAYNITSGAHPSWQEFLSCAAGLLGCRKRFPSFPYALAYALAATMEGLFLLFGSKTAPDLTRYRIAAVSREKNFILDKAQTLLGYSPKWDYQQGLKASMASYEEYKKRSQSKS